MMKRAGTTTAVVVVLCSLVLSGSQVLAADKSDWTSRTIYQVLTDRFAGSSNSCNNLQQYCGGSWAGITSQLDYIQAMGFDAIWISPIPPNTPNGYHGYWASAMDTATDINTNFGSSSDLINLVKTAASKGMWVMLDVVANHMGYGDTGSFKPFNQGSHYHDCNNCPSGCSISDWNNQNQVEICRLAGLPDLNQTVPFVANALRSWVADVVKTYGFQGIRIDTVPEVGKDNGFWPSYQSAAGVYAVGEVSNGDPSYVGPYQGAALDGVLAYPQFYVLRRVFAQKQSMTQISGMVSSTNQYFSDPSVLGVFMDNHDQPRYLSVNSDQVGYKAALTYVLYSTGIPIVYYGTEQAFHGGNDPDNREPLWPTGYSQSSPLFQFLQTIINFRKKAQVWKSPQVQRYADDSFYAFSRGDTLVCLTNVGNGGAMQHRTITYSPWGEGTKACTLSNPDNSDSPDCVTVTNGSFDIYLSNGETKIYSPMLATVAA